MSFFSEIRTFKMADVTVSEDRLKTLMKEIFKKEFEKQQKNLLNLISGNFDITMTEIKQQNRTGKIGVIFQSEIILGKFQRGVRIREDENP